MRLKRKRRSLSRKPEGDGATASSRLIRIKALDLLARREHAVLEMRRKLCYKGFDEEQVDAVLAELVSEALISDERFTASYLTAHVARGEGPLRIRAALKQKGVRDELIEDALEAHAADWQALISSASHCRNVLPVMIRKTIRNAPARRVFYNSVVLPWIRLARYYSGMKYEIDGLV